MKNIFVLLSLSLILSCNKGSKQSKSLMELNSEKTRLITQIDSLSNMLNAVEHQISKLDTTKSLTSVTTIKAEVKPFKHFIEVQGVVEADQSVELYPERAGAVTSIYVKEGQSVVKGQILVQIDNSILENNRAELLTQLELAKTTFERQQRLWNQNIGSEIQFLQAKAKKEGLENSLNSLNAQAEKLKIIAPFSGIIDEIFIKIGGLASTQTPAVRLVNLSKIHVECEVTETYLNTIKKDTDVNLTIPSIGKEWTSKIAQVGNFINPNNRSFKVRINLNNPENELKANMLADVKINDFKNTGVVIPSALLQKDRDAKTFVFTLIKDDNSYKVKKTYVNEWSAYNNLSFISEGLTPNTLIVDKGSRLIKAGENVMLSEQ